MTHNGTINRHDLGDLISVDVSDVHLNVSQALIITTEDKVRIHLSEHLNKVGKKEDWIAPLGILVTIVLTLISADFKIPGIIFSADTWKAIFILSAFLAFVWLLYSLKGIWDSESIDDLIEKLKKGTQKAGVAIEETLVINSAIYGANGKTNDVTKYLREIIIFGRIENFAVLNKNFGGYDPNPGVVKTLTVNYTYLGKSSSVLVQENAILSLP